MDIDLDTGHSLYRWLHDHEADAWTVGQVNRKFGTSLTGNQLWRIWNGEFAIKLLEFSFYRHPVTTTKPSKSINLVQLYFAMKGEYYKNTTLQYRNETDTERRRLLKLGTFDHVTFAGTFTERRKDGLKQPTHYAVFDFDHVPDPGKLRDVLISDRLLNPEFAFISPSGDGVKVVLFNDDFETTEHETFYSGVLSYLEGKYPQYSKYIDSKTKDVSRTCFICWDKNVYIKPEYLEIWQASKN